MNAQADSTRNAKDVPIPHVSRLSLWFGVLATPLAWSAHELFSYMVASRSCQLRAAALAGDHVYALSPPFLLVTAVTLALGLAGAWVAWANWRKAREETRDSSLDLKEIASERVRFLSRCGIINAVVFIAAFFFTTADILVAPLCAK